MRARSSIGTISPGNLKAKEPPVLRALGQLIKYEHDFNRLKKIDYPASTDVTYVYGAPTEGGNTAGNLAGRVKQMTSDGGSELRFYDSLGNIRETRTTLPNIASTTPASVTFTMKYSYDWLGRMRTMTFPNWMNSNFTFVAGEGELVTYFYNHGGELDRITGFQQTANPQQTSHPRNFEYLKHIGYNAFGQRSVLTSGNGIQNRFGYDSLTRRLITVDAAARGQQEVQQNRPATPFHRLRYQYDAVGNIVRMVNSVSVQPWRNAAVFVGPMDVTYAYDNLNQLKSMALKYRPHVAYGYQSSTTFRYDEIGNFTRKAQSHDRLVWDNQTVNTSDQTPEVTQLAGSRFDHTILGTSYTLDYQYTGPRPHAANAIIETPPILGPATRSYSYDSNGNNTGNVVPSETRVQTWDEESRLKQVNRNGGMLARFRYNDEGERTKKNTAAAGDSWYPNQFFVLLPNNRPTKHIFAGETRIASKTDAIYMQTPVLNHYHPDHLGTTSYTTTQNQDLVQHERYFTYGELWRTGSGVQEETDLGRPDSDRREWLFTSKEWDVDTGLYYFGARYLDPRTGVWQSPDPILADYMKGEPNGGVFLPANLGLYAYAYNNPVKLRDPDGTHPGILLIAIGYGIYKFFEDEGQVEAPTPERARFLEWRAEVRRDGLIKEDPIGDVLIGRAISGKGLSGGSGAGGGGRTKPPVGGGRSRRPATDKERVADRREARADRRERQSREGADGARDQAGKPQKQSGEGFRDRENAEKDAQGPSGVRPGGPDRRYNRERNVGIDEEHSRRPKGGFRPR
jgi:RHS repeat-associated protein